MYPTDFEADTSHLTLAEDGAYNRLLRLMWMTPTCSLPDDNAWIMRRMRCDKDTFDRVVMIVIDEFFVRSGGRLSNARLMLEYSKSNDAHKRRVEAGSKGGKAKSLITNENSPSNAIAKPKQPEPEPYKSKRDTKVSPKKRAARLPDDWVLPNDWGEWAVGEGLQVEAIRVEADKFRDYWISVGGQKGVKLNWLATWRNWIRNSNQPKGGNNGNGNRGDETLNLIAQAARAR